MPVRHVRNIASETVSTGQATTMQVLIGADEGPHFAMRRFRMEPGGSMPMHTNTVEHEQFVLRGRAEVVIGTQGFEVEPGSVLLIPAGLPHAYRALGEEAFEFLCLVPNAPDHVEILGTDARQL